MQKKPYNIPNKPQGKRHKLKDNNEPLYFSLMLNCNNLLYAIDNDITDYAFETKRHNIPLTLNFD